MTRPVDKRRHPRIAQRLRVQSHHRGDLELETHDLSAGGLYCSSPVFLAPMTRMALSLLLPPDGPGKAGGRVKGEAIVVRSEPDPGRRAKGAYRVALFFSRMDEEDRRRLHDFLESRSARTGRGRS
ncbi:MAG: PilZ domain-containing protein [Acidobacteriota bacterium]